MNKLFLYTSIVLVLLIGSANAGEVQLRSKDKSVEVTVPDGWEATTLPGATGKIQAKCAEKIAFCIVISEAKEDLKQKTLAEYADLILKLEEKKSVLADRSVKGPKKVKLNSSDALQYEIRGTTKRALLTNST